MAWIVEEAEWLLLGLGDGTPPSPYYYTRHRDSQTSRQRFIHKGRENADRLVSPRGNTGALLPVKNIEIRQYG